MRWFANLKTAQKLGLGFGFLVCMVLLVGGMATNRMAQMNRNASLLNTDALAGLKGMVQFVDDTKQVRLLQFQDILETDNAGMDRIEEAMKGKRDEVEKDMTSYESSITQEQDGANLKELKARWSSYLELYETIRSLSRKNDFKGANALMMGEAQKRFDAVADIVNRMSDWNAQRGEALARECERTYGAARLFVGELVTAAALLGLLLAWFITRYITRVLGGVSGRMEALRGSCLTNLNSAMAALAEGDLTVAVTPSTQPLDLDSRDEFGHMARTFNQMLEYVRQMIGSYNAAQKSLEQLIGEVARNADTVSTMSVQLSVSATQTGKASEDIARVMQDVARATDQSAATSQEVARASEQQAKAAISAAGAMEQLHTAVRQVELQGRAQQTSTQLAHDGIQQASQAVEEVARSSQRIAESTREANAIAQTGGKAVEQTVDSMRRISQQMKVTAAKITELGEMSSAIGAIVETIDQIAEQTNLLALNAAIEAARAGEHGKGFAVVADEVRKLAERATAATNEVNLLIGRVRQGVSEAVEAMQSSGQEVNDGTVKSQEAGAALTQILQSAKKVVAEVENVSAVAEQMAASVQEVTATVVMVRQSAEENEQVVAMMAAGANTVSSAITSVASTGEETAAGAEEMSASSEELSASVQSVSASVQEQSATIKEVNATANELSQMATRLQELVGQFQFEAEPAVAAPLLQPARAAKRRAA
jgi:methyl-accepting chemotaxis protein